MNLNYKQQTSFLTYINKKVNIPQEAWIMLVCFGLVMETVLVAHLNFTCC